tara:strand:- start:37 stop:399 length:363 start_codon:yes stop_codon:yes gene_type:complete
MAESKANGALVSLYVARNNAIKNKGDVAGLNKKITEYVENNNISTAVRRASSVAASNVEVKNKGGMVKKKKVAMMRGGMANGKVHMYAAGGSVTENPGLKALKASGPKGLEAYNKITKNA